jgi:hypothetical protein
MVSSMIPERLERQKQKTNAIRSNKAVAYIRVSTEDQLDTESMKTQEAKIEEYAQREGLEIVKWFREEGKSAKTAKKRDAMQEMLVYLARNRGNNLSPLKLLKRHNWYFICKRHALPLFYVFMVIISNHEKLAIDHP